MSSETAPPHSDAEFERRLLDRQLLLLSAPTRGLVYALPVWAGAVCWINSGAFPALGASETLPSALWFVGIVVFVLISLVTDINCRRAREVAATFDPALWIWRSTVCATGTSVVWSSLVWVFWAEGNATNQMALTICVFCGIINGVISRMNRFQTYLLGTGAAFLVLWGRFLTETSDVASIFSILLPLWFLALTINVRAASARVRGNIVTDLRNEILTAENARARQEAERANQMKTHFLANMSHELRTPMNAILGFSEIIATQALGPNAQDRYREYAGYINSSGKHLLSLINDLLDVAKVEAGKVKLEVDWIDGNAIVEQAARLVREQAEAKGVALRLKLDASSARIFADERALNQMILNLTSNAVKFTERGSVTVSFAVDDGHACLAVEDTGVGISEENIRRVFEPFEQADNSYAKSNGGTGLGLTLVRALAQLHGGTCKIESKLGKGTRVEILLPQPVGTFATAASRVA